MSPKPTRKRLCQSLGHCPRTFSRFGRVVAISGSCNKARHVNWEAKSQIQDLPSSSDNGSLNHRKAKADLSDSSESEEFDGVVQADFVFFDPKPSDFHGVKVLLMTYLDSKEWDLSGFVDLILGQPTVGTVIKIENEEDDSVYSIVTALNLGRYKDNKCMIELKDYLLEVCQSKEVLSKLKALFREHEQDVGLLVAQHVVNLPLQLLPPLYDGLFDEVEWAIEDEPTKELQNSFRLKYYLIISKLYKLKNAGSSKTGEEAIIYIKPEDEIFLELSMWSFSFPLHAQKVTTNELKNYQLMGIVMVIEASKVGKFRKQLHSLLD